MKSEREYLQNKKKPKITEIKNFGQIAVYGIDANPNDVVAILSKIHKKLLKNIEVVYYGEVGLESGKTGLCTSGMLYLSDKYPEQLEETILHELCHSLEETLRSHIEDRDELKKEFLFKRHQLYANLYDAGYRNLRKEWFDTTSFDKTFDDLLFENIGTEVVLQYTNGLFPTTYSCSSINEYVACGFELYFSNQKQSLKNCPELLKYNQEIEKAKF